jgi:hypothetical protein
MFEPFGSDSARIYISMMDEEDRVIANRDFGSLSTTPKRNYYYYYYFGRSPSGSS